jgi:hypothetical protein
MIFIILKYYQLTTLEYDAYSLYTLATSNVWTRQPDAG